MRYGLEVGSEEGKFNWGRFVGSVPGKFTEEIERYGTIVMAHLAEPMSPSPTFSDGIPKYATFVMANKVGSFFPPFLCLSLSGVPPFFVFLSFSS